MRRPEGKSDASRYIEQECPRPYLTPPPDDGYRLEDCKYPECAGCVFCGVVRFGTVSPR